MDELDIDAADLSSCRFGKILPSRLTGQSVALIVKRWALEAGFDPALFAHVSVRDEYEYATEHDDDCEHEHEHEQRAAMNVFGGLSNQGRSRRSPGRSMRVIRSRWLG
jgi:hypothetical protein